MQAQRLEQHASIDESPLSLGEVPEPQAGAGELLLQVQACGVCHTDLHAVEGDIRPPDLPITPGHQVVGEVLAVGEAVSGWSVGERAGVPWLYAADGTCQHCERGQENLCEQAQFTGFNVDGGYAERMVSQADYTLKLPQGLQALELAPLLCAGIVGFRSVRLVEVGPGERIGLVGFGGSAHLMIQVLLHWNCEVYVFTRGDGHRQLARRMGAAWVGGADDDIEAALDRAIIFAPAGHLVPAMLAKLRPGGRLVLNAIHMSPIPEFPYRLIWEERSIQSVANATYQDGVDFLELAAEIPVEADVTTYPLAQANQALADLKASRIDGAAVLTL